MVTKPIRVRFAPSPTGFLHIGGARTALFNWLFAHHNGGVYLLRLEDTDRERSEKRYEEDILEGFRWLGLEWDEELYRQSERTALYTGYLTKLLENNQAYYCFCTKEELEAQETEMKARGLPARYSGRCRTISKDDAEARRAKGERAVIRFRVPNTTIEFIDIIRKKVHFDVSLGGDFVIAKSLTEPLYNFANVIDDFEMKITYVIRGEEHLSNTAKQVLLNEALGFPHPQFAHLPLILNPDRSKMSKRFAATSVSEYRAQGYLPEALVNFLALLGWHPKDDKEVLTLEELIQTFELERVQKGGAIFNVEKLDWLNGQYIKQIPAESLLSIIEQLTPLPTSMTVPQKLKMVLLVRDRMKKLTDFIADTDFLFKLPTYPVSLLHWKKSPETDTLPNLEKICETLHTEVSDRNWTKAGIEDALASLVGTVGKGGVFWPLRVALSGKEASPPPIEIMEILGKKETLRRIDIAINNLRTK